MNTYHRETVHDNSIFINLLALDRLTKIRLRLDPSRDVT